MSYVVGELFGHGLAKPGKAQASGKSMTSGRYIANQPLGGDQWIEKRHRQQAHCRFRDTLCNGGGNRDMMRLQASDPSVGPLFLSRVGQKTGGYIPCGVCTLLQVNQEKMWAICPHRLFSVGPNGVAVPHAWLAQGIYTLLGFKSGDRIKVWSELKLTDSSISGAVFNYRFDYILRKDSSDSPPMVIEIMTCSTSGGNKEKGTDMQSAFRKATLAANGILDSRVVESPGANLRQM